MFITARSPHWADTVWLKESIQCVWVGGYMLWHCVMQGKGGGCSTHAGNFMLCSWCHIVSSGALTWDQTEWKRDTEQGVCVGVCLCVCAGHVFPGKETQAFPLLLPSATQSTHKRTTCGSFRIITNICLISTETIFTQEVTSFMLNGNTQ